jgi:transposase
MITTPRGKSASQAHVICSSASLCVTADGAVPVHFKAYDGNQTDDGIHLETWNRLRTLLQHPQFVYVADCKLCTEKNLRTIDGERGFFVIAVRSRYTRREGSNGL